MAIRRVRRAARARRTAAGAGADQHVRTRQPARRSRAGGGRAGRAPQRPVQAAARRGRRDHRARAPGSRRWRRTGGPATSRAADAHYIQVDLDAAELGRSIPAHVGIVGDVRTVLRQLLESWSARTARRARRRCRATRGSARSSTGSRAIDAETDLALATTSVPLSPLRVIRAARAVFPRETTVGCRRRLPGRAHRRIVPVLPRVRAAVVHLPVELLRDGFRRVSRPRSQDRLPGPAGAVLRRRRIVPDGAAGAAGRRRQPARRDLVRARRPGARLDPRPAGVPA